MSDDFLSEPVREKLKAIGKADVLVGIPSFNNAATIESVGKAVGAGLAKDFPDARAVIVNCDGGSQDNTPHVFELAVPERFLRLLIEHALPTVQPLVMPDHGVPGYENAFQSIFEIAEQLEVKACAVVDGNLRSIRSEWMALLINPVIEDGLDFVAPAYRRHKFDGSLTNSVLYPLNRALYGRRLRFMGGGGHGFSRKMLSGYLAKEVWGGRVSQFGIDSSMTIVAMAEGYEVCHASLGTKAQDLRTGGAELAVLLSQAVGAVFSLMEEYHSVWENRKGSSPVRVFGPQIDIGTEPLNVNSGRMVKAFRQGLRDLLPIWEIILPRETLSQILPLGLLDVEEFSFPMELWVQLVYDFALAYHDRAVHREHLLKALTPLYLGRTASFILENAESGPEEIDRNMEILCSEFEARKPYLIERWR